MDITTIKVSTGTRDRLKRCGAKGETYDALLNRILDAVEARTVRVEATR